MNCPSPLSNGRGGLWKGAERLQQTALSKRAKPREAVVNVTVFYAIQTRQVAAASDLGQADRGGILYQAMCESCHEEGGRGGEGYPWIAAQSDQYLVRALERYRDAGTGRGKRNDPDMVAVSSNLSDQNIRDMASYLANLK